MKLNHLIIIGALCGALLIPTSAQTWGVMTVGGSGGGDDHIVFYLNCDSKTANQSPQKGTGSILYLDDSHWSLVTGAVSDAVACSTGYYSFHIPVSDNLNLAIGTIGFFWRASTITAYAAVMYITAPSTSPAWAIWTNGATEIEFDYKDGSQWYTIAADTTYFIEFAWDGTLNKQSYRVNGGSWTEATGLGGSNPTGSTVYVGYYDGNASNAWWDQIMISDQYQKDLYSVRTSTNP